MLPLTKGAVAAAQVVTVEEHVVPLGLEHAAHALGERPLFAGAGKKNIHGMVGRSEGSPYEDPRGSMNIGMPNRGRSVMSGHASTRWSGTRRVR